MSGLRDLQHAFQRQILDAKVSTSVTQRIIATAAADAETRFGVYAFAYAARLVDVLVNDFIGLRALMGDASFTRLGHAYVQATPSTHYNVRWFGAGLADFLHGANPWCETPALVEMARLEWSMGLSFDAGDSAVIEVSELANVHPDKWAELRLRLHPSVILQRLAWNIGEIRRAVDRDEALPDIVILEKTQLWIVSRRDTSVRYRLALDDEAAALEAAAGGASFAELCELLCNWHDEEHVAMRAATLLKQWLHDRWVTEIYFAAVP